MDIQKRCYLTLLVCSSCQTLISMPSEEPWIDIKVEKNLISGLQQFWRIHRGIRTGQYDIAINQWKMFVKWIVDHIGKFITEQHLHMETMNIFLFTANTKQNLTKDQMKRAILISGGDRALDNTRIWNILDCKWFSPMFCSRINIVIQIFLIHINFLIFQVLWYSFRIIL